MRLAKYIIKNRNAALVKWSGFDSLTPHNDDLLNMALNCLLPVITPTPSSQS